MRPACAWLAPAVATLSLAAWYLFFGSPGPSEEVARQGIPAVPHPTLVRNALYMLACVGLYFALPARLLYRRPFQWRDVASPRAGAVAAGLLVLFVLFPPLRNEGVPVATMGLFDRMLHLAGLNGAGRVAVFYLVALGALHDLRRSRLALALVAGNAFVMMGAQFIWDKYAVPLIVVLWYLESRRMPGVAGECEAGADRAG